MVRLSGLLLIALATGCGGDGSSEGPTFDGLFATGQEADLVLSAVGFNDAGGPLLFHHNGGIAGDESHLVLADRNNNRVLIWSPLPSGNEAPKLVLGQSNFTTNDPGTGLHQMNWPVAVAVAGNTLLVCDTNNNRVLVWTGWPTQNGEPADYAIQNLDLEWPWGVWSDGTRLAVSSTSKRKVLIWNSFPATGTEPYSYSLTGKNSSGTSQLGTPRSITSDGVRLIVGDHNPGSSASPAGTQGSFFWTSFPTSDSPYGFFRSDPLDGNFAWLQGTILSDGRLFLLGRYLHVWNGFPTDADDGPDLSVTTYEFSGGDGSAIAAAGGRLYLSVANNNKIVAYDSPPATNSLPDFAVGSPSISVNTLETNDLITNPVPASNGTSLFVSSGFDRRLHVWKSIPTQSGQGPDVTVALSTEAVANAIHGDRLVLAGRDTVYVWSQLPRNGEPPDRTFVKSIGSATFADLAGVAIDDRYFYLADPGEDKIYVWEGIPTTAADPTFALSVPDPLKISSDGTYLAAIRADNQSVLLYLVSALGPDSEPSAIGPSPMLSLPQHALVAQGRLFVADTNHNRVLVWNSVEDAIAGKSFDVILGESDATDYKSEIGRSKLFMPVPLCFDGSHLWVGEFKFSGRLLRFTP